MRQQKKVRSVAGLAAVVVVGAFAAQMPAAGQERVRIITHQSYVEDVLNKTELPLGDPTAMFAYVLGSLPDRVKVYPTENYYYFRFIEKGVAYAGNIRLDVSDRDAGKVHFAYFEDLAEWKDEPPVTHAALSRANGVAVEKVGLLAYRVAIGAKSVVFELNDLSAVKPPPGVLGPDEEFIGPIFDDSAVRFLLVYNRKLKIFHYLLDETAPPTEALDPIASTDHILIGKRTGFAYYRDDRLHRKILIGVFEGNARVNNYFDGPFDQLPDNFIKGDTLKNIILEIDPNQAGKIDRLGGSPDGTSRFLIAPYAYYRTQEDLMIFHHCATDKKTPPDLYYACFVIEDQNDEEEEQSPHR
jgi:hypothetical protein